MQSLCRHCTYGVLKTMALSLCGGCRGVGVRFLVRKALYTRKRVLLTDLSGITQRQAG